MTDQDYIRKAVELADGWDSADEQVDCPLGCAFRFPLQVVVLDAIASQLVRQVDATDYWVEATSHFVDVRGIGISRKWRHESDDRTMNTIKAIVDSEVLK